MATAYSSGFGNNLHVLSHNMPASLERWGFLNLLRTNVVTRLMRFFIGHISS
jgi:hypothetical protein